MHLLGKKKEQRRQQRRQQRMSIQKRQQAQKKSQQILHKLHPRIESIQGVQGVNSIKDIFSISETGTIGGHWWEHNLSTLPGQQRRFITIQGASTYLVNIADQNFPASINVTLTQVNGFNDKTGNASHIVATMVVDGAPAAVMNGGGIVGYNVSYKLMGDGSDSFDITGVPNLSFDVTLENDPTPVNYPLNHPITLKMQILRAIL